MNSTRWIESNPICRRPIGTMQGFWEFLPCLDTYITVQNAIKECIIKSVFDRCIINKNLATIFCNILMLYFYFTRKNLVENLWICTIGGKYFKFNQVFDVKQLFSETFVDLYCTNKLQKIIWFNFTAEMLRIRFILVGALQNCCFWDFFF